MNLEDEQMPEAELPAPAEQEVTPELGEGAPEAELPDGQELPPEQDEQAPPVEEGERFIPKRRFDELNARREAEAAKREEALQAKLSELSTKVDVLAKPQVDPMTARLEALPAESLSSLIAQDNIDPEVRTKAINIMVRKEAKAIVDQQVAPLKKQAQQQTVWGKVYQEFPEVQQGTEEGKAIQQMAVDLYNSAPALQNDPEGVLQAMRQARIIRGAIKTSMPAGKAQRAQMDAQVKRSVMPGGSRAGRSTPSVDQLFNEAKEKGHMGDIYEMFEKENRR